MDLMMRVAWRIMDSDPRIVGEYSELTMSAWISATGAECKKCSENPGSWPFLLLDGCFVFESAGEMARGLPRRIDVPRS